MAQPTGRVELQIGGREAEFAAALVAVDDFARDEPRIAQKRRGLVEVAFAERFANRAGRDCLPAILQRRHHIDGKAVFFAFGRKENGPVRLAPK